MQRRAVALSAALFLVLAAGAYAFIGAAQSPTLDAEPVRTVPGNESFVAGGTNYSVGAVADGETELTWVNDSSRFTQTWEHNTTVTIENATAAISPATYRVLIPNASSPSEVTMREELNVSAILAADPDVEDQTLTRDGTEYVRYTNGTTVELASYLPEPGEVVLVTGDPVMLDGETFQVATIGTEEVLLERFGPEDMSATLAEGENVSVAGSTYVVHFPDDQRVAFLSADSQYGVYQDYADRVDHFNERVSGLWGIVILGSIAVILLVSLGYLPSRY